MKDMARRKRMVNPIGHKYTVARARIHTAHHNKSYIVVSAMGSPS